MSFGVIFFLNQMKIDFISKIIQLAKYYFLIFTFNKWIYRSVILPIVFKDSLVTIVLDS